MSCGTQVPRETFVGGATLPTPEANGIAVDGGAARVYAACGDGRCAPRVVWDLGGAMAVAPRDCQDTHS